MPNVIPLTQLTPDDRFAIVVARWNETITRKLLDGAVATLLARGVADEAIDVAWVPGSFEIPLAAQRMADSGLYAAVLCLGAVIRGEKRTRAIPHRASNISRCGVSFGACGRTYTSIKPT